ncbi:terpene synthase family protein (plasmid) [Streptomyces sp. BI20]|uniref:terpene synthase family protein n=1 Tax=Streptomyces sp. BI20 TaxID=3403460 RepID=UPI003C7479A3
MSEQSTYEQATHEGSVGLTPRPRPSDDPRPGIGVRVVAGPGGRGVRADERVLDWCRAHSLLLPADPGAPNPAEGLRRARYGTLAARAHPHGDEEALTLLAHWYAWGFLLDDHLDRGPGPRPGGADALRLLDDLAGIPDPRPEPEGTPPAPHDRAAEALRGAFTDLWTRTARGMAPAVRRRLVGRLREYFEALADEETRRRRGIAPDEAAYLATRRVIGGLREILDIADHLADRSLPDHLDACSWQRELRGVAADIVDHTGDLASWRRELAAGETHNLVLVLARERGLDHAEAAGRVARRLRARAARFETLAAHPPHPRLVRRAEDLRHWVTGFTAWLGETARHAGGERAGESSNTP